MEEARPLVSPVLLGRDDLLAHADRRIGEASRGRGQFLLIAGEAGLGKTRLLSAIERSAAAAGFRVVRAGTYPSDVQVPAAILMDLARALGRDPTLGALGARLAARLEPSAADDRDPGRRRRTLVLDVADILADVLATGSILIGLEDLHWSDDLTLEMLEAFSRRIGDLKGLVVGTYRSDELVPRAPTREWRSRLLSSRRAEEIRLRRLTVEETATMTAVLQSSALPTPREVAEAVHARTDGIPLHVEELLALLAGHGPATAESVRDADVPVTVEDAIQARLHQRSDAAIRIARVSAVIGRSFDLDLLGAVAGDELSSLSEPLAELADHFILLPAQPPGRYGFRHALIGDAIYASIPEPERRRLHGLTAEAATARHEIGTDAFLALHFERAGRREDAFRAALAAAEAATAISSHTEARELFECALRTRPDDLPPAERARILEAHATSAAATDANQTASASFEAAREAWLEAGDRRAAAASVGPYVAARHLLGDPLEVRANRLRAALAEIGTAPSLHSPSSDPAADRVRGRLLAALGAAYMLDRRLPQGIDFSSHARDMASRVGDTATDRHAATTLGACLVFAGRMDEGWSLLESVIAAATADHDEASTARAYRMIGSCASVLVEYERGERWLRAGIEYAERVERWNDRHYMAAHLAHVLWATGRWDEAESTARRALADGRGGITTRLTALTVLGYLSLGRDRLGEARTHLDEAFELASGMHELQRTSPVLWGLAECAHAAGDAVRTVELSATALQLSETVEDAAYLYPFLVTAVRAHTELGDVRAGRDWLERASRLVRLRAIPGTLAALDHADGLLALVEGATGRARTALLAAGHGWDDRGRAWEGVWAQLDLARCRLRSNQRTDAAAAATDAAGRGARLPAPRLVATADGIVRSARRGAEPEPWAPLTAREFEIARLVADGRTNVEIGEELSISRKTVAAHVEHMLAKLGVNRRAEIATWTATRPAFQARPAGEDRR